MKVFSYPLTLTALIISACTIESGGGGVGGDVAVIPQADDPCGAATVQFLVGRSESALQGRRYAAPLRLLRDGDTIDARDVDLNRLTVAISQNGRIASLKCG